MNNFVEAERIVRGGMKDRYWWHGVLSIMNRAIDATSRIIGRVFDVPVDSVPLLSIMTMGFYVFRGPSGN